MMPKVSKVSDEETNPGVDAFNVTDRPTNGGNVQVKLVKPESLLGHGNADVPPYYAVEYVDGNHHTKVCKEMPGPATGIRALCDGQTHKAKVTVFSASPDGSSPLTGYADSACGDVSAKAGGSQVVAIEYLVPCGEVCEDEPTPLECISGDKMQPVLVDSNVDEEIPALLKAAEYSADGLSVKFVTSQLLSTQDVPWYAVEYKDDRSGGAPACSVSEGVPQGPVSPDSNALKATCKAGTWRATVTVYAAGTGLPTNGNELVDQTACALPPGADVVALTYEVPCAEACEPPCGTSKDFYAKLPRFPVPLVRRDGPRRHGEERPAGAGPVESCEHRLAFEVRDGGRFQGLPGVRERDRRRRHVVRGRVRRRRVRQDLPCVYRRRHGHVPSGHLPRLVLRSRGEVDGHRVRVRRGRLRRHNGGVARPCTPSQVPWNLLTTYATISMVQM